MTGPLDLEFKWFTNTATGGSFGAGLVFGYAGGGMSMISSVPEPSTLVVLGLLAGGWSLTRRRRAN